MSGKIGKEPGFMKRNELAIPILMLISVALVVNLFLTTEGSEAYRQATLYLAPNTVIGPPPDVDETFTLTVVVNNVNDLWAWNASLIWETDILSCITAVEGPFLQSAGVTRWASPRIDNAKGTLTIGSTLLHDLSVDGTGVLATVTFQVVGRPTTPSTITFNQTGDMTQLLSPHPPHNEMPYSAEGATYQLALPLLSHSVNPRIYLAPETHVATQLNEVFVVSVMVDDVVSLRGFNVAVTWDPTIVEYVGHTNGTTGLLAAGGGTVCPGVPAIEPGHAVIQADLLPNANPPPSFLCASGSGVLFDITFKVVQSTVGSEIRLTEARLIKSTKQCIALADVGNTTVQLLLDCPKAYTLTVNVVGSGTVTRSPDQATYPEGTEVSLTAVPENGWEFSAWSGDASGTTNPVIVTMDAHQIVTATFTKQATGAVVNPTARFTPAHGQQFFVGDVITLDASTSTPGYDPLPSTNPSNNPITSYRWQIDVGDDGSVDATVTGETTQWTIPVDGSIAITLTIRAPDADPRETHPDYDDTDAETHVIHASPRGTKARIDLYTDRGGIGHDVASDVYGPQEEVLLYALVTYNDAPVVSKDVAFHIMDSTHNTVSTTTARSNGSGIAFAAFRIPWPDVEPETLFGTWRVVATVDVASTVVKDSVDFKFGYLVEIVKVDAANHVARGSKIHVNVTLQTIQVAPITAHLFVSLVDEVNVPVATAHISITFTGDAPLIIGFDILVPRHAFVGTATVYANAYDQLPLSLGVPYCPEATDTFSITI